MKQVMVLMKFQMFHLNRIKYLILAFLFITFIPSVKAIVNPTSDFYVNDYANILSKDTKQYIMDKSVALNNVDETQIVVVTVKDLEGNSIEDYAVDLFRKFGIGDSKKNNGILILVSVSDRRLRIEVGYGLEGIINDGKAGRIRDEYMIPYLRDDDWNNGIKNGYDAIYSEIVKQNNLNIDYTEPVNPNNDDEIIYLIISLIIGIVIGLIARSMKYKNIFTTVYGIVFLILFFMFANLMGVLIVNLFTYMFIAYANMNTLPYIYISGGRGGRGGFGGGSFGGFSGGGGSSGGGGASGSF